MRRYRHVPPLHPDPALRAPFRCDTCDVTIATDYEPDLIDHERDHARMLEMTRWTGPLITYAERRVLEHEVARVLVSDAALADRVAAAKRLLGAYHHRFLRKIAREGNPRFERCSPEDFIAAANLEGIFSVDVAAVLRAKHGRIAWPEIAMRHWVYRD